MDSCVKTVTYYHKVTLMAVNGYQQSPEKKSEQKKTL